MSFGLVLLGRTAWDLAGDRAVATVVGYGPVDTATALALVTGAAVAAAAALVAAVGGHRGWFVTFNAGAGAAAAVAVLRGGPVGWRVFHVTYPPGPAELDAAFCRGYSAVAGGLPPRAVPGDFTTLEDAAAAGRAAAAAVVDAARPAAAADHTWWYLAGAAVVVALLVGTAWYVGSAGVTASRAADASNRAADAASAVAADVEGYVRQIETVAASAARLDATTTTTVQRGVARIDAAARDAVTAGYADLDTRAVTLEDGLARAVDAARDTATAALAGSARSHEAVLGRICDATEEYAATIRGTSAACLDRMTELDANVARVDAKLNVKIPELNRYLDMVKDNAALCGHAEHLYTNVVRLVRHLARLTGGPGDADLVRAAVAVSRAALDEVFGPATPAVAPVIKFVTGRPPE